LGEKLFCVNFLKRLIGQRKWALQAPEQRDWSNYFVRLVERLLMALTLPILPADVKKTAEREVSAVS
jgi:hypothetical protein